MLLNGKEFKTACAKIFHAIDKENNASGVNDLVELDARQGILYINVTNKEYFISLKFNLNNDIPFKVTVAADIFLKLIAQLTTEEIEIIKENNYIKIISNGVYKIPIIYNGNAIQELTPIEISNPVVSMQVDGELIRSILFYNSKELQKGFMINPTIQKLHYIDDQGAITFTTGACVNKFNLPQHVQLLINNKIVKLFKLFEEDEISFTVGYDNISETIIQTKISLETPSTKLTAILSCDDSLVKQIPFKLIRERAEEVYPYSVSINKDTLAAALSRLLVFTNKAANSTTGYLTFTPNTLTISDVYKENKESIGCESENTEYEYEALIDLNDLKLTLDTCTERYLNLSFGNKQALLITRLNVVNILPECEIERN